MGEGLVVAPRIEVTLAHRKASSDCCGAKLNVAAGDFGPRWTCRACGRPCERVMSEPVEVTAHG
jgi:hypothetical protein